MRRFENKTIAAAVTGGIAAYKACDLIRQLQQDGAKVIALMTPSAQAFISPLTLECLTQHPVYTEHLQNTTDGIPTHIALAQQCDALIILPASAQTIAKLAHGMADNMVTTTALTFTDLPVLIAPAMNTRMWHNPLVQANINTLQQVPTHHIIAPDHGLLACGETGDGKLANLSKVITTLYRVLHPYAGLYQGQHYIVSAGGTQEPLDAVRTLSNRSSGKMGLAIARELYAMGTNVTLVHTLPQLEESDQKAFTCLYTPTVAQMDEALSSLFPHADGIIMAAAVSDYTLADDIRPHSKRAKTSEWTVKLTVTSDIVAKLGTQKQPNQVVVGFAAQSGELEKYAQDKLKQKNLDMIVANDIAQPDIGFNSDQNAVTLFFANGATPCIIPKASKAEIAQQVLVRLHQYLQLHQHPTGLSHDKNELIVTN